METAYLFVHFREKDTPDGEQVYFGISEDGFHWETVNDGQPYLWCYYGEKGARDFTITFCRETGKYVILGTDLSLAYGSHGKYRASSADVVQQPFVRTEEICRIDWKKVSRDGSQSLSCWESEDLIHWSQQRLIRLGNEKFGCLWAPDIVRDETTGEYVVHWSSSIRQDEYEKKRIFCSRTRDFQSFTKPVELYSHPEKSVIDSAIYAEGGSYYLFVKREGDGCRNILLRADQIEGPYEQMKEFDESTAGLEEGVYEAPTAVKLEDGRWCLFLDYYGVPGEGQGYVPFVANSLESGRFVRADEDFSFPYGFKHGTILPITRKQYERLKKKGQK